MGKRRQNTFVIRAGTTLVQKLPKGWGIRFEGDQIFAVHPTCLPRSLSIVDASRIPFHKWPEISAHG